MRVFVDTNVVLDVLARREPFFGDSRKVLDYCERHAGCGILSALTYSTVAYVLRKYAGTEQTGAWLLRLHGLFQTSAIDNDAVSFAIKSGNPDFEDALQYASAISADANVIVTRDPSGFLRARIRVMSPAEFNEFVKSRADAKGDLSEQEETNETEHLTNNRNHKERENKNGKERSTNW